MTQRQTQVSEKREEHWTEGLAAMVVGAIITTIGLIFLYLSRFWGHTQVTVFLQVLFSVLVGLGGLFISRGLNRLTKGMGTLTWGIVFIVGMVVVYTSTTFWITGDFIAAWQFLMLVGLGFGVRLVYFGNKTMREDSSVAKFKETCPFCDKENTFFQPPNSDWDCDFCHRTARYENGEMVPVTYVMCTACRAEHRVPVNVKRYLCDQCNRPLNISGDLRGGTAIIEVEDQLFQNFDVLLVAYDRRLENELAFKIQNLLVVNMLEARRMINNINNQTPLIVGYNLPERKADAIRRDLQVVGGTARLRPTKQ